MFGRGHLKRRRPSSTQKGTTVLLGEVVEHDFRICFSTILLLGDMYLRDVEHVKHSVNIHTHSPMFGWVCSSHGRCGFSDIRLYVCGC